MILLNPCPNWQSVSNNLDHWIPHANARNDELSVSIGIRSSCLTSFCKTHAWFVVVVTWGCSNFFASAITNKSKFSILWTLNNHSQIFFCWKFDLWILCKYLSLRNNRYCNQALVMMLEINTDSEQNFLDQEHFSWCLELEDTVRKKNTKIAIFFFRHVASLIVYLSWNKISYRITNYILSSDRYTRMNCYRVNCWIPEC